MSMKNNTKANKAVVDFPLPEGECYEVLVPDTLDLVDRAELAINAMGSMIDPELGYLPWWAANYMSKKPIFEHHVGDVTCAPMIAATFSLMRIMCGSDRFSDLQAAQEAGLLSRVEDGLYWLRWDPSRRPWDHTHGEPKFCGQCKDEDTSNVAATGLMLRALLIWRELDGGDSKWDAKIAEVVQGLNRIAIHKDDYSYYPNGGFGEAFSYPRSGWLKTDEAKSDFEDVGAEGCMVGYHGSQILGLSKWYGVSGDPLALKLAGNLARYCMKPTFWGGVPDPQGSRENLSESIAPMAPSPAGIAGFEKGHFHATFAVRALALRGLLEYARVTGDERVFEFVRNSYEWMRTFGIPRIGWINTTPCGRNQCDGHIMGDLVVFGIRFSDAGLGDYWDDVDAVVRNHLVEQQVQRIDILERIAAASPNQFELSMFFPGHITFDKVIERSHGAYFTQSLPGGIAKNDVTTAGDCTFNSAYGLYSAWEGTVREDRDRAQVNLLINRAAKTLDIDSYIPHEGKVIIHNKAARRISVRIPAWVPRKELRCTVSGQPRECYWIGNYVMFDELKPGDNIKMEFPIGETTAHYTVSPRCPGAEEKYKCTFRGSTLVDISPREDGTGCYPFYLRDDMRKETAPMKKKTQFVPKKVVCDW